MQDFEDLVGSLTGHEAHVLGNGPSRLGFERPKTRHVVFGCNAAYRDTDIDILLASDTQMVQEIIRSDWDKPFIANSHTIRRAFKKVGNRPTPKDSWIEATFTQVPTTGFFAVWAAARMGCDPVHLWGFDGGKRQNIYAGTRFYERASTLDWNRSIKVAFEQKLLPKFPDTEFIVHGNSYLESRGRRVRPERA